MAFEMEFRQHHRDDFQRWFAGLAKLLHSNGDLQQVRITRGDGGLDCFVISLGRVYACFAPSSPPTDKSTAAKIDGDFESGQKTLGNCMKEWVFIHNHPESELEKEAIKAIAKLQSANPTICFQVWGREQLWKELSSRVHPDLLRVRFGPDVGSRDLLEVDLTDIQSVVRRLASDGYSLEAAHPTLPSLAKLDYNNLSDAIHATLMMGRKVEPKVKKLFSQSLTDVERGERIAEAFRKKYRSIRDEGRSPDETFDKLLEFVSWDAANTSRDRAAVFGVLSYFFHSCDIFENPPGDTTN